VSEVFRVGPSLIHSRTGSIKSPHGERWLRRKELELLMHLYEHVTQTFSREKLLHLVWNYQPGIVTRTVDQTVATLRKKIEFDSDRPRFLQTVYGIGYRLVL
jgi:DNA-binding response OmpR family regulator